MIFSFKNFLPDWRKGSILSRIFRNFFEKKQIKKIFGIFLILCLVLSNNFSPVFGLTNEKENVSSQEDILIPPLEVITTQETFQKPVTGEISQAYHWYHQAIDIAGNNQAPVYPIASGKITEIGYQLFGYGNYVVIKHSEEIKSLYAHLKTIKVGPEEEVKKDTVLGLVGSTGRSTGPHLHLEIFMDGKKVNPLLFIKDLK